MIIAHLMPVCFNQTCPEDIMEKRTSMVCRHGYTIERANPCNRSRLAWIFLAMPDDRQCLIFGEPKQHFRKE